MKAMREVSPGREERLCMAAEWLLRIGDPGLHPSEAAEFERWCAASPENRRCFEEIQSLWQATGAVQETEIDPASIAADRFLGEMSIAEWRRARTKPSRMAGLWDALTARRAFAAAGAFAVIATLAVVIFAAKDESSGQGYPADLSIATEPGMNRDVLLPDGSRVTVAGGSRLSARFTREARTLVLDRGEAFFRIQPDKSRPFTVNVMDTRVTAIGTAFNVRAERDVVRVAVTEGAVSVDHQQPLVPEPKHRSREIIQLVAGHQVTLSRLQPDPIVVNVDVERATAWLSGTLKFVDEPLSSVVSAVNRYTATPVSIDDAAVGEYRYTGTVVTARVDEWLRGLPDVFPVEVVERAGAGQAIVRSGSASP